MSYYVMFFACYLKFNDIMFYKDVATKSIRYFLSGVCFTYLGNKTYYQAQT